MTAKNANAAVANADKYTSYEQGYCLKFVRSPCWQIGSLYGSAIDAWNGAKYKHPGDRKPPKGAPMFYRGGSYGHIVISRGGGQMRSTDCTSATHVSNAALNWPENAWGDDYLGWTEDLNGVRLPLGDDTEDDDMPQRDHATTNTTKKFKGGDWHAITWDKVPVGDAFDPGDVSAGLGGRKYVLTVGMKVAVPEGATFRIQIVEYKNQELMHSHPQAETVGTSGATYPQHASTGVIGKDNRMRVRIYCGQDFTLEWADVEVLSW